MRSSSKKLALTSVAYAVTLMTIGAMATIQLNAAAAVQATKSSVAKTHVAELHAMEKLETKRLADARQVAARYSARDKTASLSAAEYKPSSRLTGRELSQLLYQVGFEGNAHKIAWAIVMRESSGRPMAHNDNTSTGDNSYGLFQINMIGDLGADRRDKFELRVNSDLFDPVLNAKIAHHMSAGGDDFGSWGIGPNAYRSGAGIDTIRKWFDDYPGIVK